MKRHYYYYVVSAALFIGAFVYSVVERSKIPHEMHRTSFGTSYVAHQSNDGLYQIIIISILVLAEIALFAGGYSRTRSIAGSIGICIGAAILFVVVAAVTSAGG